MQSGRLNVALVLGGLAIGLGNGCVSLDDHRQLQMAHRKLGAEKEQLETELYDSRNLADNLRAGVASAEDRLRSKDALVTNLEAENDRLDQAVASASRLLEEMAKKDLAQGPIIIETKLPPALDSALKDFAAQFPGNVVYDAKRGIVKWTADLLFALGSDVVKESGLESLTKFAEIMNSPAAAGFDALVVGHTDDRPIRRAETEKRHPTNWHLSVHRAISVSTALQNQSVSPQRVGVMGFGEYRPLAANDSEASRSQNRRVEIYVVPEGSVGGVITPETAIASQTVVHPAGGVLDDGIK